MGRSAILLAMVAAMVAKPVSAATITAVDSKDGKTRLNLTGEIAPGDNDAIKAHIKKANDAGRVVVTIRLDSIGGNLLEGVAIADTVKNAKMATAILSGAKCASACFIIFAAGNEKYAHFSASVGVHGASDASGNETVSTGAATVSMARIAQRLGVPAGIIGKMVVTPPSRMVWLTPDDLRSMGTSMLGKPEQLARENAPTQLPQDISPNTQASTSPPTWSALVDKAIKLSSDQNNGRAKSVRICQPEFKICTNGVYFKLGEKEMLVKIERDLSEKIVSKELCEFNSYGDIRRCLNWDTNVFRSDMQDKNGKWFKVSEE